ncbi:MAG: tripartite tricarboxylate transporter substrate binding protein [Betaproteobacteria bacterium]|nr:tripartite tricarboxylate transporter substrate binding protein [Betaproteobacteria bacterium]
MPNSPSSMLKPLGLLLAFCACAAAAQTYPSRQVRIVVPFAPGGGTDVAARVLAQKLTERVGQSFIVDNRPGASGIIGTELVAKSAPDGYTLLVGSQTVMAVVPAMYGKLNYDTVRDFVPVIRIIDTPTLIAVHPSLPVKSIKELIALAKARPGQLSFGGASGGTPHMFGELFKTLAQVDLLFVPYKGEGPAIIDAMGGQISMVFSNLPTVLPLAQSGKLRPLAVSSAQRVSGAPGIPTIAESGLPDYIANSWFGLYAPVATPREIVTKINTDATSALNAPEVKDRLAAQGMYVVANTPEQFAAFLKTEIPRWAKVVKDSGVKPQ